MKISEWQNWDTVPEVPGIYQRKITPDGKPRYAYWDGEYWYVSGRTIVSAKRHYVKDMWISTLPRPWRGVIE